MNCWINGMKLVYISKHFYCLLVIYQQLYQVSRISIHILQMPIWGREFKWFSQQMKWQRYWNSHGLTLEPVFLIAVLKDDGGKGDWSARPPFSFTAVCGYRQSGIIWESEMVAASQSNNFGHEIQGECDYFSTEGQYLLLQCLGIYTSVYILG